MHNEVHFLRLYGLETSSFVLMEYALTVFENGVPRQNLLSSRLLPKNLKIKIYRTIILPVVLYGCENWSLTLREERKLSV